MLAVDENLEVLKAVYMGSRNSYKLQTSHVEPLRCHQPYGFFRIPTDSSVFLRKQPSAGADLDISDEGSKYLVLQCQGLPEVNVT